MTYPFTPPNPEHINACPICGNYRADSQPPELHKCQRCGFVSGFIVHTDDCPGCRYRREEALK